MKFLVVLLLFFTFIQISTVDSSNADSSVIDITEARLRAFTGLYIDLHTQEWIVIYIEPPFEGNPAYLMIAREDGSGAFIDGIPLTVFREEKIDKVAVDGFLTGVKTTYNSRAKIFGQKGLRFIETTVRTEWLPVIKVVEDIIFEIQDNGALQVDISRNSFKKSSRFPFWRWVKDKGAPGQLKNYSEVLLLRKFSDHASPPLARVARDWITDEAWRLALERPEDTTAEILEFPSEAISNPCWRLFH